MTARSLGHVASVGQALREESGVWSWRCWLLNLAGRLAPAGGGGRLRVRLYRALGVQVGRGTIVHGGITFATGTPGRLSVTIGERSFLNRDIYFDASAPIRIGSGVSIGHHVVLVTSGHEIGPPEFRAGALRFAPVTIGDGAWIAAGAMLLPGVTVGPGAVVAAGAVVTRDVPANALVGGVPAKPIRRLDE